MKKVIGDNVSRSILTFYLVFAMLITLNSNKISLWTSQKQLKRENFLSYTVLTSAEKIEAIKSFLNKALKRENFNENHKETIPYEELTKPNSEEKEKGEENNKSGTITLLPPYRFLIIGDSFVAVSGGVGEIIENELLNYKETTVKRLGVVSSGLSRRDYFDWYKKAEELINEFSPNIVIVIIGSNDAQTITGPDGKKVASYGDENWNEQYKIRVSELLKIFKEREIVIFWIGLPIMKEERYSSRIKNINNIYEEQCSKNNAYFFPTWNIFADEQGRYKPFLKDENGVNQALRQEDGIHMTYFGGKILVKEFMSYLKEKIGLEPIDQ
jgi:hypothetical protein